MTEPFVLLFFLALQALVAQEDPEATIKWNDGVVERNSSCAGVSYNSLDNYPLCASQYRSANLHALLYVTIQSMNKSLDERRSAIASLEAANSGVGHPAIDYLLANMFGTGRGPTINYRKARFYAARAAEQGNAAAANLLATFLIDGKGGPRDVDEGLRWHRYAATNGFAVSGYLLGGLYAKGQLVERDLDLAKAYFEATADAGLEQARRYASLIDMGDKVQNLQLIPAPHPADVEIINYTTLENPEIPPAFGFTPKFQEIYRRPHSDEQTLQYLEENFRQLPTPYTFELSRRLISTDNDRAIVLQQAGRIRLAYDIERCVDPAAKEALSAWNRIYVPEFGSLLIISSPAKTLIESAIAEFQMADLDTEPWWICRAGTIEYSRAASGDPGPLRLKPRAEWPAIQESILRQASMEPE